MKKSLSFFLAVIMLLSAFSVADADSVLSFMKTEAAAATKPTRIYYGDIDRDQRIDASDARAILRYSVGLAVLNIVQKEIADCNADGSITAADARITLRASVKLEQTAVYYTNILSNAEFLTLLTATAGLGSFEEKPYFSNVSSTHKSFKGVQAAVDWGLLDKNTPFEPDADATKADALAYAKKVKGAEDIVNSFSPSDDPLTEDVADSIANKVAAYRKSAAAKKEFESVEIKNNVKEYSKNDVKAVDEDTFTVKNNTPKTGEVFIAETADGEVARKVKSVKKNSDGSYTVETTKPEMDEVFDDFSFYKIYDLDPAEVDFIPADNVFIVNDPTEPQLHMADSKEKVILDETFRLNSSNDKYLTPKLSVSSSSDYIKALKCEYTCQVDNAQEALEKYNQLINGVSSDKKTLKTEKVAQYTTGWGVEFGIKLSNFELEADFSDFWTDGDYSITLMSDVKITGEFAGTLNSTVKLGHFPVKLGLADLILDVNIDVYLYFDANGNITLTGDGKIQQTCGSYRGKADIQNNNSFSANIAANIEAEGGLKINPSISAMGLDIASMDIRIGVFGKASAKLYALVEYNENLYYYAGDYFKAPDELKKTAGVCADLSIAYPIVYVTATAGEDMVKKLEKMYKKNPAMLKIPTTYTFTICTLDSNSLLRPAKRELHFEATGDGIEQVNNCKVANRSTDYNFIAHKVYGYAVEKATGNVLSSACVELLDDNGNVVSSTTTDALGNFELKFIPFGIYKYRFSKNGIIFTTTKKCAVAKNETNVGKIEVEFDEAEIYAKYLNNGGYDEFYVYTLNENRLSKLKVTSCCVDLSGDGIRELLITLQDTSYPGPRGYHTESALLTINPDKNYAVEKLLTAENFGGTGGGDDLSIKYDKINNKYVVEFASLGRAGIFANAYLMEIYSGTDGFTDPVKQLKTEAFYLKDNDYYANNVSKIKSETSLYYIEDDYFRYYKIDGSYVTEARYDDLYSSFVAPTDSNYTMKQKTLKNPA